MTGGRRRPSVGQTSITLRSQSHLVTSLSARGGGGGGGPIREGGGAIRGGGDSLHPNFTEGRGISLNIGIPFWETIN